MTQVDDHSFYIRISARQPRARPGGHPLPAGALRAPAARRLRARMFWLTSAAQLPFTGSSNADPRLHAARLRHQVLPALAGREPRNRLGGLRALAADAARGRRCGGRAYPRTTRVTADPLPPLPPRSGSLLRSPAARASFTLLFRLCPAFAHLLSSSLTFSPFFLFRPLLPRLALRLLSPTWANPALTDHHARARRLRFGRPLDLAVAEGAPVDGAALRPPTWWRGRADLARAGRAKKSHALRPRVVPGAPASFRSPERRENRARFARAPARCWTTAAERDLCRARCGAPARAPRAAARPAGGVSLFPAAVPPRTRSILSPQPVV